MVFILGILQNGYSVKKPRARSFFTMVQMAFVRCSDGRCPFGSSCLFDGLLLQCWHAYQTGGAEQDVRFAFWPAGLVCLRKSRVTQGVLCAWRQ